MDEKLKQTVRRCETAAAAEHMMQELPSMIEAIKVIAALRKASYDAHIAAGFTEEQALTLCRYFSSSDGGGGE